MRLRVVALIFVVAACDERPTAPKPRPPRVVQPGIAVLDIPTYEESGESVHPDVAIAPAWWGTSTSYLAITPYPGGDAQFENPSLFTSGDDQHWELATGAPNPLQRPSAGYLSDPDVVFDPAGAEMRVYYRQVTGKNIIRMIRSVDGAHWSTPITVVQAPDHEIVSPSIVRLPTGEWRMWSVNSGASGCSARSTTVELRASSDGIAWSAPTLVDMPRPPSSLSPWHLDVQWIPSRSEYWALFNAKDGNSCGTTALYLATSADGEHWSTLPNPVLVAGETAPLERIVYRSTFAYDGATDQVRLWYSGARLNGGNLKWATVVERLSREALFTRASGSDTKALSSRAIPQGVVLANPP